MKQGKKGQLRGGGQMLHNEAEDTHQEVCAAIIVVEIMAEIVVYEEEDIEVVDKEEDTIKSLDSQHVVVVEEDTGMIMMHQCHIGEGQ